MTGKRAGLSLRGFLLVSLLICLGPGIRAQRGERGDPTSGRIISIVPKEPKGTLKVKQGKKLSPVNATEGMLIRRGYMLILGPAAKATVICGDGKKHDLQPGAHGCPCIAPCTPEVCGINYDGSTIGLTRGSDTDTGLFPVIISPRRTRISNLRPTIRWRSIARAKDQPLYHVTLYGDRMQAIWIKDVVAQTWLAYPADAPPLAPGQDYKAVVIAGGQSSQQDHSPGLGFTTLTSEAARRLAGAERQIKQLLLPEPSTRFLIANLYTANGLYAEAIEQLEDLYPTMQESAVARLLGDLYVMTGLNREAEKRYLEALHLTAAEDFEGVGLTWKSLAQVYENLGFFDQAVFSLVAAQRAYCRLGKGAMVRALLKDKRRLKPPKRRR